MPRVYKPGWWYSAEVKRRAKWKPLPKHHLCASDCIPTPIITFKPKRCALGSASSIVNLIFNLRPREYILVEKRYRTNQCTVMQISKRPVCTQISIVLVPSNCQDKTLHGASQSLGSLCSKGGLMSLRTSAYSSTVPRNQSYKWHMVRHQHSSLPSPKTSQETSASHF